MTFMSFTISMVSPWQNPQTISFGLYYAGQYNSWFALIKNLWNTKLDNISNFLINTQLLLTLAIMGIDRKSFFSYFISFTLIDIVDGKSNDYLKSSNMFVKQNLTKFTNV